MEQKEQPIRKPEQNLTDQDLYDKAYSYFSYHAGQRTNMINYFIGVFGAAVALYGALLQYPAACICISGFMLAVSVLFLLIDIRTKFDIKHSEKVLCQFEKNYGVSRADHREYPLGAFSNESNVFQYFDYGYRKERGEDWKNLKADYKKFKKGRLTREKMDEKIVTFMGEEKVPVKEIYEALGQMPIAHLSTSITWLYRVCILVSVIAFFFAIYLLWTNGLFPEEAAQTAAQWITV